MGWLGAEWTWAHAKLIGHAYTTYAYHFPRLPCEVCATYGPESSGIARCDQIYPKNISSDLEALQIFIQLMKPTSHNLDCWMGGSPDRGGIMKV